MTCNTYLSSILSYRNMRKVRLFEIEQNAVKGKRSINTCSAINSKNFPPVNDTEIAG